MLHVDKDNCPRYKAVASLASKGEEFAKVQNYFLSNYAAELSKLTNTNISTFKEMTDVCSYIQWAELANLTLKFKLTPSQEDYCLASGDSKLYSVSYGLPELW